MFDHRKDEWEGREWGEHEKCIFGPKMRAVGKGEMAADRPNKPVGRCVIYPLQFRTFAVLQVSRGQALMEGQKYANPKN